MPEAIENLFVQISAKGDVKGPLQKAKEDVASARASIERDAKKIKSDLYSGLMGDMDFGKKFNLIKAADAGRLESALRNAASRSGNSVGAGVSTASIERANDELDAFMGGFDRLAADLAKMGPTISKNPFSDQASFDDAVRRRKWSESHVSMVDKQFGKAIADARPDTTADLMARLAEARNVRLSQQASRQLEQQYASDLRADRTPASILDQMRQAIDKLPMRASEDSTPSRVYDSMVDSLLKEQAKERAAAVKKADMSKDETPSRVYDSMVDSLLKEQAKERAARDKATKSVEKAANEEMLARRRMLMGLGMGGAGWMAAHAGTNAIMSGVNKASPLTVERFQKSVDDLQAVMARPFIPTVNAGTGVVRSVADRWAGMSEETQSTLAYGAAAAGIGASGMLFNAGVKRVAGAGIGTLAMGAASMAAPVALPALAVAGIATAIDSVFNGGKIRKDLWGAVTGEKKGTSLDASGMRVMTGQSSDAMYSMLQTSALREGVAKEQGSAMGTDSVAATLIEISQTLKGIRGDSKSLVPGVNEEMQPTREKREWVGNKI